MPECVKRLVLSTYRYAQLDLAHLDIVVAEGCDGEILGAAASEPVDPRDAPGHGTGLLLHGLYVEPRAQHRGLGSQLLHAAEGFFTARGFRKLPVEVPECDYPHRYWKDTAAH